MYLRIGLLKLKTIPFTYLFLKVTELNLEYLKADVYLINTHKTLMSTSNIILFSQ